MKVLLGLGASNCLLLLQWARSGTLEGLDVKVYEPFDKIENDKTFCFWARPEDDIVVALDALISKQWRLVKSEGCIQSLEPLRYYKVQSSDLYQAAKKIIEEAPNVHWSKDAVVELRPEAEGVVVRSMNGQVLADQVFDSRPLVPEELGEHNDLLLQSFLGWEVEFPTKQWHPAAMTLMDFDVPQDGATQFLYVLPSTERIALVELTRFGQEPISDARAEELLDRRLKNLGPYKIRSREVGVIPMSQDYQFHHSDPRIVSVGARAGCIKASTGYAFLNMFRHAQQLDPATAHLSAASHAPSRTSRFYFYDTLLLHILKHRPQWGREIFKRLFAKRDTAGVLQFLDEQSTPLWEVVTFAQLPIFKFLWALVATQFLPRGQSRRTVTQAPSPRWSARSWSSALPALAALLATAFYYLLPREVHTYVIDAPLLALLGVVGIPHGALDVFASVKPNKRQQFILRYLFYVFVVLALWWWQPQAALWFFLAYSAWHFGQTDLEQWNISSRPLALVWGGMVLSILLIPHQEQVGSILSSMGVAWPNLPELNNALLPLFAVSFLFAALNRSLPWMLSILSLALLTQLPLFPSFLIYFVIQHSFTGGLHLKRSQGWTWSHMWRLSLPFTLGAGLIYALYLFQWQGASMGWESAFFVVLSALSLPHVVYMSRWYAQRENNRLS